MTAPILLFVYNRPEHTRRTIEALSVNILADQSELFIYSDAPKGISASDKVREVRSFISAIKGFKSVTIIEREKNWGLAASIIDGVTNIVNQYGKVIVLEDDIVTSPYFLSYMNDGLTLYENDDRVISIHGYVYPLKTKLPDYFFIKGADCWGWATWKRGWNLFNPDGKYLLNEIKRKKLQKEFDFNNTYKYMDMLQAQIDGKISSWAVRWYASAFLADKYTLYPGNSFVRNIGLDGSGIHCGTTEEFNSDLVSTYTPMTPIDVKNSRKATQAFIRYFYSVSVKNTSLRIFRYVREKIISKGALK
jgi:hypothetical protein